MALFGHVPVAQPRQVLFFEGDGGADWEGFEVFEEVAALSMMMRMVRADLDGREEGQSHALMRLSRHDCWQTTGRKEGEEGKAKDIVLIESGEKACMRVILNNGPCSWVLASTFQSPSRFFDKRRALPRCGWHQPGGRPRSSICGARDGRSPTSS